MNANKFWAAARNAALKVVAFWVLILAAYLALGRQFFPYIDQLKPEIEIWLSQQLGAPVEIGQLRGEWVRFNPVVHLTDVTLGQELTAAEMTLAPGIYESVARGGPSFIRFEVNQFNAELKQTDSGWAFAGLSSKNDSPSTVDVSALLALLQRQQTVQFSNTRLSIQPLELPAFELELHSGTLSGYGEENGLLASATLHANQLDIPIELQIETSQNAHGLNRIYFRHGEINLTPWLQALNENVSEASVAGEYWLNLDGEQWQSATSRMQASSLTFQGPYADIQLADVQLETYVEARANGFEAWLNLLNYQLNGQPQNASHAKVSHRANRIKAQWDQLPASFVGSWFALNDPNGFWRGLSPRGFVEQGTLTYLREKPESLIIAADVVNLSLQAHQSVPGLTNLAGRLRMEGRAGEMQLKAETSNFQLTSLYDTPFDATIPLATMRWDTHPIYGLQASGYAEVSLQPKAAAASFEQSLPVSLNWTSISPTTLQRNLGRQPLLELFLDVPEMNEYWLAELADNQLLDTSVPAYIRSHLNAGKFNNVQLNYAFSRDAEKKAHSQFFIHGEVAEADFSFLDNWYALTDINGQFYIDNQALAIAANSAQYPGFDISTAQLTLPFKTGLLGTQFNAQASASDALMFLTTGPLRAQIGTQLDSWLARGAVNVDGQLRVPLGEPSNFASQVNIYADGIDLNLRNIDMQFADIQGALTYSTEQGLYAEQLTLQHQGLTQQVQIDSELNSQASKLNIYAQGQTPVRYWGQRFDDVYLSSQDVNINHESYIQITPKDVIIESRSDLMNWVFDFPAPLNKQAEEKMPLRLTVHIDENSQKTVDAQLDNQLLSRFTLDARNDILKGDVAVNLPLKSHEEQGVFFDIAVAEADGDAWWRAIQQMRALYAPVDVDQATGPGFETLIQAINIQAETVSYLAQPWTEAAVTLLRNKDAWLLDFQAEEGAGQVLVPHEPEPIFADINWLSITTGEEDIPFDQAVDPLLAYVPHDVPNMQLQINKLVWNGKDLGTWRSEIETQVNHLKAKNTVGEMNGAVLRGELDWYFKDGEHQTDFNADIELANLFDVLTTWQYAPVLTSQSGEINIESTWQGSPANFDFKRLQGSIDLNINRGSILQVEEYEGIKLIGLLNFTRVIQRIALDFSDLLREGLTYDTIEGELLFDRGFARVGEKLEINGSATKFKFSGDADLLSDALDVDMVLTVPLSSTFPLVALLAGVTPQAAAAIYVTERVFNNELERLSSARLHITGSFDAPETKFYRVDSGQSVAPLTAESP